MNLLRMKYLRIPLLTKGREGNRSKSESKIN